MIYEVKAACSTLLKEGPGSLLRKLAIYFGQLGQGVRFLGATLPVLTDPVKLLDFGNSVAGGFIQPSQVREEILGLLRLVAERKPKTVVEIGTANGGSLFLLARLSAPDAHIISIDLPNGIHGGGYPYWKTFAYRRFASPGQSIHLRRANSQDPATLADLRGLVHGRGIDLLFIDGDHTYGGVKQDFVNYSGLVNPGGLIVFHDICKHREGMQCEVDVFWNEIKSKYQHQEFIHDPRQGWAGIGVLFV